MFFQTSFQLYAQHHRISARMDEHLAQLVALVKSVALKYKLASVLSLKTIVMSLINEQTAHYLRDTNFGRNENRNLNDMWRHCKLFVANTKRMQCDVTLAVYVCFKFLLRLRSFQNFYGVIKRCFLLLKIFYVKCMQMYTNVLCKYCNFKKIYARITYTHLNIYTNIHTYILV